MAGLMSSFLTQLGAVSRVEATITRESELAAAADYLKRLLASARPVRLLDAKPDESPYLDGRENQLRAAVITRQGILALGLRDLELGLKEGVLYQAMALRRLKNGQPDRSSQTVTEIADGLSALKLSYLSDGGWSETFREDGALPDAIRIELSAQENGREIRAGAVALLR